MTGIKSNDLKPLINFSLTLVISRRFNWPVNSIEAQRQKRGLLYDHAN